MAKSIKSTEPKIGLGREQKGPETAVAVKEAPKPKAGPKPIPAKKTVRFIAALAAHVLIVNPEYETTETLSGGRTKSRHHKGDAVKFQDNYAEVPEELVEDIRGFPNYRIDYLEVEELKRMVESDDAVEREEAEKFLARIDKHRAIQNKQPLTKRVLAL